jgi:23S rRNA pseudouridine2604 synthase
MSQTESVRLSKRLAEQQSCSRREAELYIEAGHVQVDGKVVLVPGTHIGPDQEVRLAPGAKAEAIPPVTLLLHKPAGYTQGEAYGRVPSAHSLLTEANLAEYDTPAPVRVLSRHFDDQVAFLPIPVPASGLVIYTQDPRIARKLQEDAYALEQECVVGVKGQIVEGGLQRLCKGGIIMDRHQPLPPAKVSWQNETHLRFAIKGFWPDKIAEMCAEVGLEVVSLRRLRVGRVSMAKLPEGQWRYLLPWEKF